MNALRSVKNFNHPVTETDGRAELARNLKQMTDEVMIWRHKILRNEALTRPGLFIMHFVSNKGPLKLTECSAILGVSKPTVTKIVDNLEKDGFVRRIKEGRDRRSYFVHLTDQGKDKLGLLDNQLEKVFLQAIGDLGDEDVRSLSSSVSIVSERLRSISKQGQKVI